ncbi:CHAT domain-containing protein [Streptomyces sp. NPDC057474]|uniref:CHAT domain-containing protein n=1 Tax=Streptomyces sp. NPDC057474 TaxID=3346144 RepID=UPI003694D3E6
MWISSLFDVVETYREEPDGLVGTLLRGAAGQEALAHLSAKPRVALLLLMADVFAAGEVHVDDALSAAERALDEARSLSGTGEAFLAEALFRAGRLLAYCGADADHHRGLALLDEAASLAGPELCSRMAADSGLMHMNAFLDSEDIQDLERAVAAYRSALAAVEPGSPDTAECRVKLAAILVHRFRTVGGWEHLTEALELLAEAVSGWGTADPRTGACHDLLLDALDALLSRTPGREDLDRAVGVLGTLLSGPAGAAVPGVRDHARFTLAHALELRWLRGKDLADLRRHLELLTELRDEATPDSPPSPDRLAKLAMAVFWYGETAQGEDGLDQALQLVVEALAGVPDDPEHSALIQRTRAILLEARAKRDGAPADLDTAIDLLEQAARHARVAHGALTSLGITLLTYYDMTQQEAYLDRAVRELDAALAAEEGPQDRMRALQALHNAIGMRYGVRGTPEDLERMRALARDMRAAGADTPDLRSALSRHWAEVLGSRFSKTGDRAALGEAVAVLEAQLADGDADPEQRDHAMTELALALWQTYLADGDVALLTRAITLLQDVLPRQPLHSFARAQVLGLLGLFRRDRYVHRGDGADLDAAIGDFNKALADLAETDDKYAEVARNYGLALWDRYGRDGNLYDLDRAIDVIDAVFDGPTGGGKHPEIGLNTLGVALRDRYHISSDPRDLHRAVEVYERAVASLSVAETLFPGALLSNYGATLLDRYLHTGDLMDLSRSIEAHERSVDTAPSGSPNRPRFLLHLAGGLESRYQHLHDIQDIDRAVRLLDEALDESPDGWVNRPTALMALGRILSIRYLQLGRRGDRRRAVESYRAGCTAGLDSQAGPSLIVATKWAGWVFAEGSWSETTEACDIAFQAMTDLFEAQFGRRHKERWLSAAQGIAAQAAYALAMENAPEDAVVALERGRALQLSEVLQRDRAQLDDLVAQGHGDIVRRYRRANQEWSERIRTWEATEGGMGAPVAMAPVPGPPTEEELLTARRELDASIAGIRRVRADFLVPPKFGDVAAAAHRAPLVYLTATAAGGVAIIVTTGGDSVRTVWLPELTEEAVGLRANDLREAHDGRLRAPGVWRGTLDVVTAWLWNAAMRPVLDCLGTAVSAVLVPTGLLGMMPLHAAWTPDASAPTARRYAMDDCVLSYAPNARSLRTAQDIADRVPMASLLTVHDPMPSEHPPLSFAAAEVAAARAHFASSHGLSRRQACVSEVTAALARHQVHHFACHGVANLSDPLRSALILAEDQPLTLADLLQLRLTRDGSAGVRLVILSSCESQVPGLAIPDEVVSLPTGLLQAGVAGITATQWAVEGLASCLLMTQFHQELRRTGATPATALRAAQQWVRNTTNAEKVQYLRAGILRGTEDIALPPDVVRPMWRALVCKPPQDQSFAHIADWAAFSHVGV